MNEKTQEVKITFGIIVLNGEPFTKYCLRSLYKFAHEIIVVEGATLNAKSISTPDGHSIDSTLKSINEFISEEDTEKKIRLVTRDGFWKEKDEMSQAYASIATGNYLWQIDVDEFYLEEDMEKVLSILKKDPSITAISFLMKCFWGGIEYAEESPVFGDINRIFKFGPGYKYINHRPPTLIDEKGNNLRNIKWLDGTTMRARYGIYMYHYSVLFPAQVSMKAKYYASIFKKDFVKWADNNYFRLGDPYHVNDNFWRISWLRRYEGNQPKQILAMMKDVREGKMQVEQRDTADIEKLLQSPVYVLSTYFLRSFTETVFKLKRVTKNALIFLRIR